MLMTIRRKFNECDLNDSGTIERDELAGLLRAPDLEKYMVRAPQELASPDDETLAEAGGGDVVDMPHLVCFLSDDSDEEKVRKVLGMALKLNVLDQAGVRSIRKNIESGRFSNEHYIKMFRNRLEDAGVAVIEGQAEGSLRECPGAKFIDSGQSCNGLVRATTRKTDGFWRFSSAGVVLVLFNCVPRPVRGPGYGRNGRGRQNGRVVACNLNSAV